MTVVDTSALFAILLKEEKSADIETVLRREACMIPAPVLLEFATVVTGRYRQRVEISNALLNSLLESPNMNVVSFDLDNAAYAKNAVDSFGKGRGNRAQLNMIDLMVYGIAKRLRAPILCTGRDFAETDIAIHPASRLS